MAKGRKMKISKRLKLCCEIMFLKSGHKHSAQEKQLSTFQNGYKAGMNDKKLEYVSEIKDSLEPFGNVLSKLESQIYRDVNCELPPVYKDILREGFDARNRLGELTR